MRSVSEVAIGELEVGKPLEFDLLDPAGRVLLNAGHVLSQRTIDRWKENGFARAFVATRTAENDSAKNDSDIDSTAGTTEPTPVTAAYNSDVLAKVDHCTAVAQERLTDIVSCLVTDSNHIQPACTRSLPCSPKRSIAIRMRCSTEPPTAMACYRHRTTRRS